MDSISYLKKSYLHKTRSLFMKTSFCFLKAILQGLNSRKRDLHFNKPLFIFLTLTLTIILFPAFASAITLKWDIPVNDRMEIVKTADVKYFVNSRLIKTFQERNIVDLTCYYKDNNSNHVKGLFSVFRRESSDSVFLLRNQYRSDFLIEKNGNMQVDKKYMMPNLRNVPAFPLKNINIGDSWNSTVNLIIRSFSIPVSLLIDAEYTLISIKNNNNRKIAVIKYNYIIKRDFDQRRFPADFPIKIAGKNTGIIRWDLESNFPVEILDKYRILFVFKNRTTGFRSIEFQMNIKSVGKMYSSVTRKEKEKAKKELRKELPDLEVDIEKRGLVLRLGEVLFDFNSHRLKSKSKKTLDKVIAIIKKKYPDREIIVEGHTDNIGKKNYNINLSKKRARFIADHLKPGITHDKISYRGFGSDKPITDNRTKAGRQKNRRVEIIIKLN